MDQGNHFFRCDFQIHSPRDINWKGQKAVSDEERHNYSKTFIKDCRKAGLQAIAISDHHDLVFFEYIKKASIEELDDNGNPVPERDRIVVFPATELTMHTPPIQGLLILDADFPESLFPTVLGALSIAQASKTESKTAQTNGISQSTVANLNELYEKLDETDGLKGRYIFLPHIKENGHKTIMRDGFHDSYARMPCVGGYVDGLYSGGSDGYEKILKGEVDAWGFKTLAVIQTSDYRGENPIYGDVISTWVKWAKPTAEALRQACLAKESRISLQDPEVPNVFIEKVDVTASAFMGKFSLDLNPQMNSIIGGRGTGKSTILEYVRWALCDQTGDNSDDEEKSEIQRKRSVLIDKTLGHQNGEVRVYFMVNGTRHIVKRSVNSEDVLMKIGDGEFQSVRPNQVRELLPIQAYSQKQLSSVAVRPDELKRFIQQPISKSIDEYNSQLENLSSEIKTTYSNLSKSKLLKSQIEKDNLELKSYRLQIEKLRGDLKGMSEDDRQIIEKASLYTNEGNRIKEVDLEYSVYKERFDGLKLLLDNALNPNNESKSYENEDLIKQLEEERIGFLKELNSTIDSLILKHNESTVKIEEIKGNWKRLRDEFEKRYKEAKEKTTSSQQTLNAIKEIEQKIEKLGNSIRQKSSELAGLNITEDDFSTLYGSFIESQKKKTDKLKEATLLFSSLSKGLIKADFTKVIDIQKVANQINYIFSSDGLGIQKNRAEVLCENISSSDDPILRWRDTVYEFKSLAEFHLNEETQQELPHTPILDLAGFTPANKRKICESLKSESFLNLSILFIEYLPKFNYMTNNEMGDEIPFEDASAGQQATALLNVLLNQEGYPLIIDQPEDDIDNRAIDIIIKNLWSSKQKRQIVISSHNANLVVNGDSELVICCDYNETSEQTKGYVKYQSSIDSQDVKKEITSVMEGGERAFKLRKEKYGF